MYLKKDYFYLPEPFLFFFSETRKFFLREYELDIENFESGSRTFLQELFARGQCQVSIFSDSEGYKRIEMFPEVYDPLLNQVNLLLTQYLRATEPGKVVR
jgi:hypothetical protein